MSMMSPGKKKDRYFKKINEGRKLSKTTSKRNSFMNRIMVAREIARIVGPWQGRRLYATNFSSAGGKFNFSKDGNYIISIHGAGISGNMAETINSLPLWKEKFLKELVGALQSAMTQNGWFRRVFRKDSSSKLMALAKDDNAWQLSANAGKTGLGLSIESIQKAIGQNDKQTVVNALAAAFDGKGDKTVEDDNEEEEASKQKTQQELNDLKQQQEEKQKKEESDAKEKEEIRKKNGKSVMKDILSNH